MATIQELNDKILATTVLIQEQYPELVKYLVELPITIPNQDFSEVSAQVLTDYLNTLEVLMKDYSDNHPNKGAE